MAQTVKLVLHRKLQPKTLEVIKDFILFCQKKLRLKNFPEIHFHPAYVKGMTTGEFIEDNNEVHVLIQHRLALDILRTIAHELAHAKQYESGMLPSKEHRSKNTDLNSDYENDAYIKAGNYVKEFVRGYTKMSKPEIYALHEAVQHLVHKVLSEEVRKKMDISLPSDLLAISDMFKKSGKQFFLVGGAVRDAIMGKDPKDLDIATDAQPDDVVSILNQNPNFKILEVGKAFGVVKVITPEGNEYEIATFRRDIGKGRRPDAVEFSTMDQDAARRDLTMNALYYDIERGEIVDHVGGLEDIEKGVVRTVGYPHERFEEDRLRILRAIRFAARMGNGLDPSTAQAIKDNNSLVGVSGERIRDEFIKGIKSAKSVPMFYHMISEFDLWPQIFPGLNVSRDFKDTKNVPVALGILLRNNDWKLLSSKLNALKYPSDEVSQITFFSMFKGLAVQNAVKLKKLFKNSRLGNEDLLEFSKLIGVPEARLVAAFIRYEPSITGTELQAQGLSGKELGQEMERRETEIFRSLT